MSFLRLLTLVAWLSGGVGIATAATVPPLAPRRLERAAWQSSTASISSR